MSFSNDHIAAALREAREPGGIGRLLAQLGYDLVEPPDGVPFDRFADRGGEAVDFERRHVASGGGIEVVLALDGGDASSVGRMTRLRALLGGAPRPVLLLWPAGDVLTVASAGLDGRPRALSLSTTAPRGAEVDTLADLAARDDGPIAALARHARALDRSALTRRFFRDFRAQRDAVSGAWSGLPERARPDRDQLALLLLSRLVFLYFLQKQGQLLGSESYLIDLVRASARERSDRSIFRRSLAPLFFGVFNTPAHARSDEARAVGDLPYLNGGLFERHALERAHPALDLPDAILIGVFEGLLERYRFTAHETGERNGSDSHVIQPEMLGRMFEGLMAADRRGETGTFYTPAAVVDRIVRRALQGYLAGRPGMDWRAAGMILRERSPKYAQDAAPARDTARHHRAALLPSVRELRVLDPACGSGAFVLGALERITALRRSLGDATPEGDIRRDLASNALHGVDIEPDAALLCALRIWLALAPRPGAVAETVRPLPNLDHRVRQGDALLDPMDLAGRGDVAAEAWQAAALDPGVRRARRLLSALVRRYSASAAEERMQLRRRLARCELRLARRWIDAALIRLDTARRSLHARMRRRDLFGDRDPDRRAMRSKAVRLHRARAELRRLDRQLRDRDTLPFFSFGIHFGASGGVSTQAGFDLIVSNPPWVRSHSWPRAFSSIIRSRYRVCRDPAWRPAGEPGRRVAAAGQVDLALLFVERALELLRPGGVLALMLPAKAFRSLSAGAARSLVRERADVLAIEDHALNHRAIFRADAFAGVLVARAGREAGALDAQSRVADSRVRVTMTHRRSAPLRFTTRRDHLCLEPGDPRSPWLIAPPDTRRALRSMQARGRAVASHPELVARRGAMTGSNALLLFDRAERKLGDAVVAWPAAQALPASHEATHEDAGMRSVLLRVDDLCPVIRGSGIRPFRYEPEGWVAWCHDDETAAPREPSARLERHLARNRKSLRARAGWRPGLPDGLLFRLDATMLGPRVAWRDIAPDLEVVRLPARMSSLGAERPLIALNTVYFFPVQDDETALALCALLTSLPCRVFARSIAERAKDLHFRFLAWTVSTIPLPHGWRESPTRCQLAELAQGAHESAATCAQLPMRVSAEIDELVNDLFALDRTERAALERFDRWLAGRDENAALETTT